MRKRNLGMTTLGIILVVFLLLILLGTFPAWPHAAGWGYGPPGIVTIILVIVIVLLLIGRL